MNRKCLLCQRDLNYSLNIAWLFSTASFKEMFICTDCKKGFRKIKGLTCKGCGRPHDAQWCPDCLLWQKMGRKSLYNQALYCYQNEAMKNYFKQYKFNGDYYLRKVFQAEFQQFINQNYPQRKWKYCIIPVDRQTMIQERGFNQVEGLTENLKIERWLEMNDSHHRIKQSHKDRTERMKTSQPFVLKASMEVKGQAVVLIDDVYTTGRTLYHAQDLLLKAGARQIRSITLAR